MDPNAPPRVFAISDLHADYEPNRRLIDAVSAVDYTQDALIVAGDVSEDLAVLEACLATLRRRFARVFFLPGNHELWVRHEPYDSLEKLERILRLCATLGVETEAADCGAVRIVPLHSWYEVGFVPGPPADAKLLAIWSDFRRCRWDSSDLSLAERMSARNDVTPAAPGQRVITFSHFLPRPELVPPRQFLLYKALGAVSGSSLLESELRRAGSSLHIYGHTHINREMRLDGVRYIQNALGYPRERRTEIKTLPILDITD